MNETSEKISLTNKHNKNKYDIKQLLKHLLKRMVVFLNDGFVQRLLISLLAMKGTVVK